MQSSNETDLRDIVAKRLRESVPSAGVEVERFDQQTLLVMTAEQILAGFSFGATKEDFWPAYEAFKRLFAARRSEWAALDVSFAFCYRPESISDDSFASSIETDVFFCRKFALELSENDTSALSRLPFLPLVPVTEGGARPPSAQTLLQRSGVSSDLARALVVPGNRSAQRIVEDHLGAAIEELDSSRTADDIRLIEQSTEDYISILSITITNFRAYRGPTTFEFGQAITVFYGPNGFGKTSIFDALDFVATGGIGRLKLEHNSAGLQKSARHLDSGDSPSEVELRFERAGKVHTLLRTLEKPSFATLDDRESVGRKEVLTLLTGSEESPIADRIDNLVSLFRATHSFNQESSELTQGFAQSCQLSADLVSRMLAFDDYVRAIKKVDEVNKTLDQKVRSASEELGECESRLRVLNADIHRVEGLTSVQIDPDQLTSELMKAAQELSRFTEQPVRPGLVTDADPRSIRSEVDGLLKGLELRVTRLNNASALVGRHGAVRSEVARATARLQSLEESRADLAGIKDLAEKGYSESSSKSQADRADEARLQSRQARIKSLASKLPTRATEVERLRALEVKAADANAQLEGLRARQKEQSSQEEKLRVQEGAIAKSLVVLRSRLSDVESLKDVLPAYALLKQRAAELSSSETALSEEDREINSTLEESSKILDIARQEEVNALAEVAASERERSEVSGLLAALREHIKDETCLLCGVKHESAEELLKRVDATLEDDSSLKRASHELSSKRSRVAALSQENEKGRARQAALRARISALQSDRKYNDSQLIEVRARFSDAGVGDSSAEVLEAETDVRARLSAELERQGQAALESQEFLASAGRLEAEIRVKTADWKALSTEVAVARAADRDFKSLSEHAEVSMSATQSEVEQLMTEMESLCSEAALATARSAAQLAQSRSELEEISGRVGESRKAIDRVSGEISSLRSQSDSLAAEIMSAGLSTESLPEEAAQAVEKAVADIVSLQQIRDRMVMLEHAMETLATSAVLESSLQERNRVSGQIDALREDIGKSETLRKYFSELARMLENRRNQATREFTEQYGPRTAVIQRRLRPVYGFGDISVSSRNGAISVEVMRNGEPYRPIDYFSQSQVQTLVLGLFLTAAGSQSWSSCASILMDDPVSHFDDLNTYALIDLLAGLANSAVDARQFIISTCDEKLMQIARHKFQHLGEKARIYRFQSIGHNGPEVSEVGKTAATPRLNS